MNPTVKVTVATKTEEREIDLNIDKVLCIGFAGRNRDKVMEHVRELEEIGVTAPRRIPIIYPCTGLLVTAADKVQVIGEETSGEVEFVIVPRQDRIYVGLCSDHTDRAMETVSIEKSKQCAPKPIAPILWDYEEVQDHWDDLILRSWAIKDGTRQLYQDGKVSSILKVDDLLSEVKSVYGEIPKDAIIYSGTLPTRNGFVYASRFEMELEDPILKRKITHYYNIENMELSFED
ncbi:MAG: DUF2848 family protein [Desulfitobacteriaceae bacterium]